MIDRSMAHLQKSPAETQSVLAPLSLAVLLVWLLSPATGGAEPRPLFDAPAYPTDIGGPTGPITTGDLDGDGRADLLVEDARSHALVPFLSRPGWSLERRPALEVGRVHAFRLFDLDGDGRLDLIGFPDGDPARLHIWRGLGSGSFEGVPLLLFPGTILGGYELLDLDRDGRTDLAAIAADGSALLRVLRASSGEWADPESTVIGPGFRAVGTGDLDGDRHPDVVAMGRSTPWLLVSLTDRKGRAASATRIPIQHGASAAALADFDGDRHVDVAVAHEGYLDFDRGISEYGGLRILYGHGDGTLEPWTEPPLWPPLTSVTAANLDGDRRAEIVTQHNVIFHDAARVTRREVTPISSRTNAIELADLNGDGVLDLAAGLGTAGGGALECRFVDGRTLTLTPGRGDGSFGHTLPVDYGTYRGLFEGRTAADLDQDGRTDLAFVSSDTLIVLRPGGSTDWIQQRQVLPQPSGPIAAEDFDQDGDLDLVIGSQRGRECHLLPGTGAGGFESPRPLALTLLPDRLAVADLDGDGLPDLLIGGRSPTGDSIVVLRGAGGGAFTRAAAFGVAGRVLAVSAHSARDGLERAAILLQPGRFSDQASLRVLGCTPPDSFWLADPYPLGGAPMAVRGLDLDGDGGEELLVLSADTHPLYACGVFDGSIEILAVSEEGTPERSISEIPVGEIRFGTDFLASDLDSDGRPDLAIRGEPQEVRVFRNQGNGTFAPEPERFGVHLGYGLEPGDFNGDERPDIAQLGTTAVSLLLNRGPFPVRGMELVARVLSHVSGPKGTGSGPFNVRVADSDEARVADLDPATVRIASMPAERWSPIHAAGSGTGPGREASWECARAMPLRGQARDFRFKRIPSDAADAVDATPVPLRLEGRAWTGEPLFALVCPGGKAKAPREVAAASGVQTMAPWLEPRFGRAGTRPEVLFEIERPGTGVSVRMVDVRGRRVASWEGSAFEVGRHRVRLDARAIRDEMTTGIYFVDIRIGDRKHRLRWLVIR